MLDLFLELLRSGLYGTPVAADVLPREIDWKQIIALSRKHTVMGIIFEAVSRLPEEAQPPKVIKNEMLSLTLGVMSAHKLLNGTLSEVVDFYRRNGIECVLLKGQGIAQCYRDPSLRQCGDIDLYIGHKNYRRSIELAKKHLDAEAGNGSESIKHYDFDRDGVEVELHRIAALLYAPHRNRRFQQWITWELENPQKVRSLDFNGIPVNIPSANFDALFIFYHAWHHLFRGGIGLRHLCDWAMTLHRHQSEIDREEIAARLDEFALTNAWQIFGCMAVKYLNFPEEEMPLYDSSYMALGDKMFGKLLEGGNFGFHRSDRALQLKRRENFAKRKFFGLIELFRSYSLVFRLNPMEYTCYFINTLGVAGRNAVVQLAEKIAKKDS